MSRCHLSTKKNLSKLLIIRSAGLYHQRFKQQEGFHLICFSFFILGVSVEFCLLFSVCRTLFIV